MTLPASRAPAPFGHVPDGAGARWTFVATPRLVAALGEGVPAAVARRLWDLAAADPVLEDAIEAVPLGGRAGPFSFALALVSPTPGGEASASVVVRGDAAVDAVSVGGSRRLRADGARPWLLADVEDVTGLVFTAADAPLSGRRASGADALPLLGGLVCGVRLDWSPPPDGERTGEAPRPRERPRPLPSPSADELEDTVRVPGRGGDPEATSLRSSRPARLPEGVGEDTVLVRRDAAPREAGDRARGRPRPQEGPSLGFRLGDGPAEPLVRPVVLGRDPRAPRTEHGTRVRLRRLDSPEGRVSATHVRIERSGDAVVVTDLRSSNGTLVVPPGRDGVRLRPGQSLAVLPGTRVDLGDGNVLEIVPAPDGERA